MSYVVHSLPIRVLVTKTRPKMTMAKSMAEPMK
jgi:hypothetical protein